MKVFSSEQIRAIDQQTIQGEPILSVNLMERAATKLLERLRNIYPHNQSFSIVTGPGNNGGDGLALARLLHEKNHTVEVIQLNWGASLSKDSQINLDRLKSLPGIKIHNISEQEPWPEIPKGNVLVEGIFGSGLTRPTVGFPAKAIHWINSLPNQIVSIDIPSGLFSEDNSTNTGAIVQATHTICFQFPKLAFFIAQNEFFVGDWHIEDIQLLKEAIDKTTTNYSFQLVESLPQIKKRRKFAHKGDFGHALLVAGSYGKTGAAVLAAKACLKSGVGLLSVHVPQTAYSILQTTVPEAMLEIDETEQLYCTKQALEKYSVVGVGPGIGTKKSMREALFSILQNTTRPMVLDADALNILSCNKEWMGKIPKESIITPHPKEFDRLTQPHQNQYSRLQSAISLAKKLQIIVVLKGAHTAIADPKGNCWFNSTGNPALAKGGSGDALTGIILGFMAGGYKPCEAAQLGVFVHGKAADMIVEQEAPESITASQTIEHLGKAISFVRENH